VDTVVTRCRSRENDEKRVAAEIYDAGNARQRDGGAKRMTSQSSLSLFFELRLNKLGPIGSLGCRDHLRAVAWVNERGTAGETKQAHERGARLGCSDPGNAAGNCFFLFYFCSNRTSVLGLAWRYMADCRRLAERTERSMPRSLVPEVRQGLRPGKRG
jgi:hypothetical protein